MIFFFTVVTVILPALILAGLIILAASDARDARIEIQGFRFGIKAQSLESRAQSLPTSTFTVRRARRPVLRRLGEVGSPKSEVGAFRVQRTLRAPRRIFTFLSAKFGKCS